MSQTHSPNPTSSEPATPAAQAPGAAWDGQNRRHPLRHWVLFLMRIVLGAIFLFSAYTKIAEPRALADSVEAFQLLPAQFSLTVAVMLIWHELVCGTLMMVGMWTRAATLIIAAMLTVFQVGLISVMLRGIDVNCGCFGAFFESKVSWLSVTRNFVLLGFSVALLYFGSWRLSLDLIIKVRRRVKAGGPGWRQGQSVWW